MKKEAINPGYSNPIFEFSDKKPDISRVEFVNSETENGKITYILYETPSGIKIIRKD